MTMRIPTTLEIINQALGEASVLFMSHPDGGNIVMPTEDLIRIGDKANKRIIDRITTLLTI